MQVLCSDLDSGMVIPSRTSLLPHGGLGDVLCTLPGYRDYSGQVLHYPGGNPEAFLPGSVIPGMAGKHQFIY